MGQRVCHLVVALLLAWPFSPGLRAQEGTVVFLVRHAERADDGMSRPSVLHPETQDDPHLSEAGHVRAALLAEMLRDVGLTHIHSTDYLRTRETAEPVAAVAGLEILTYDASDLEGLAASLRALPGRHLIVGHSNTTPELVQALGGEPGEPIESMEYDRLYILTLDVESASTVLLRFGSR